jgi:hypothetical protein
VEVAVEYFKPRRKSLPKPALLQRDLVITPPERYRYVLFSVNFLQCPIERSPPCFGNVYGNQFDHNC